jgi:hypothetical protein
MDWSELVLGAVVALIVLVIGTYLANTPKSFVKLSDGC